VSVFVAAGSAPASVPRARDCRGQHRDGQHAQEHPPRPEESHGVRARHRRGVRDQPTGKPRGLGRRDGHPDARVFSIRPAGQAPERGPGPKGSARLNRRTATRWPRATAEGCRGKPIRGVQAEHGDDHVFDAAMSAQARAAGDTVPAGRHPPGSAPSMILLAGAGVVRNQARSRFDDAGGHHHGQRGRDARDGETAAAAIPRNPPEGGQAEPRLRMGSPAATRCRTEQQDHGRPPGCRSARICCLGRGPGRMAERAAEL